MKLNARDRTTVVVLIGGGLLGLWVYVAYLLLPLWAQAKRLGLEVAQAQERLRVLETMTRNEALVRKQHEELSQTVASLRKLLPSENELPVLIGLMSDLAVKAGLKLQTVFPARPVAGFEEQAMAPGGRVVYREIPIEIDALGGYHQLGAFLSLVEGSEKLMRLNSLRIARNAPDPRRHNLKLVIHGYFAAEDTGAEAAPRTAIR